MIFGDKGFLAQHVKKTCGGIIVPRTLINCAGKVHGIGVNQKSNADMLFCNLASAMEAFEVARLNSYRRIVNFGSACAYSGEVHSPFKPKDYLKGDPEPTNAGYAEAKRMIYKMGRMHEEQYGIKSLYLVMPNLYGPGDHFDATGHVIPNMIERMVKARDKQQKEITFRGTGDPIREFLYVGDAAQLIEQALWTQDTKEPVHLTSGRYTTIKELADLIKELVEYKGEIKWDATQADGQKKRILQKGLQLEHSTTLREGLCQTIRWYYDSIEQCTAASV